MKLFLFLTFLALTYLPYSSPAQEYSYTHYDIGDGLAGSTVFCITQDKDGFIWTGTETGVSRFDGTHFKTFSTADGLPDVEVLQMYGDSKGRVWMAPFRRSVCYYYKGKIYNQENDSALKKVHLKGTVQSFAEDRNGNILIQEYDALHLFTANGQVKEYDSIGHHPIHDCAAVSASFSGHFLVQENKSFYELSDDNFRPLFNTAFTMILQRYIALTPQWVAWRESTHGMGLRSILTGKEWHFPFPQDHITFTILDDSLLYLNETIGSREYNIHTGASKIFLPGVEVSRTFKDDEGNTWFTTLGQGLFRLNSDEFINIHLQAGNYDKCPVYSLLKVGKDLYAGSGRNRIFRFGLPDLRDRRHAAVLNEEGGGGHVLYMDTLHDGKILFGMDYLLGEFSRDLHFSKLQLGAHVKTAFRKNERELLVTSSRGCTLFDTRAFRFTDTLFHERSTVVYSRKDSIYIGTLNGLYLVNKDRSVTYLGDEIPFFKKRIAAIAEAKDGTLWIAAYDDGGIVGYKQGRIVAALTRKQGLTSDICRNLLVYRNNLWVGTDKGLNKVDLTNPELPVTRYTSNDGLGSDIINTVYADGSRIYVGTSVGLSIFDEARINTEAGCRLALTGVINSGKDKLPDTADLQLPYTDDNIRFEFAGISYKSVGNILYRYRLKGLDSNWKNTKETFLEYPSLPSGSYEWQLVAINKFGVFSKPLSLHFTVTTPFWKAAWFYSFGFLVFLVLTWLFLHWRIRRIRRRQEEKDKLSKKMAEMERMALQAQMNPHFIFNCLNSIQQYIFDQDIFAANKYITGFAKLIRGTLQNSTQAYIPLADEIAYLSAYLSLEKLRFKEKMDYSIEIEPSVKAKEKEIFIPPMLIQPYVENSMRHGLRHKTDGRGHILIRMSFHGDIFIVLVEDNGVGREKAARYKTGEHIEYQSKGMSLTAGRVRLINSVYGDNIKIEVTDLKDDNDQPAGTRVILQFSKPDNNLKYIL
ncbi:MAG TPA: histidine kinase [Puia sp.]|jgi:hypothetical protein|nr:histidine kinase [Puia sp.]